MTFRVAIPYFTTEDIEAFRRRIINFLQSVVWTRSVRITTSPYTVLFEHTVLLVDATSGAITLNLPAVSSFKDGMIFIKKIDSTANQVIVHPSATDMIDNVAANRLLITPYAGLALTSDGAKWWIF